jgi:hypothetical protein
MSGLSSLLLDIKTVIASCDPEVWYILTRYDSAFHEYAITPYAIARFIELFTVKTIFADYTEHRLFGRLNRGNDLPALIYDSGSQYWYLNNIGTTIFLRLYAQTAHDTGANTANITATMTFLQSCTRMAHRIGFNTAYCIVISAPQLCTQMVDANGIRMVYANADFLDKKALSVPFEVEHRLPNVDMRVGICTDPRVMLSIHQRHNRARNIVCNTVRTGQPD